MASPSPRRFAVLAATLAILATGVLMLELPPTGARFAQALAQPADQIVDPSRAESLGVVTVADTLRFTSILGLPRVGKGGRNAIFSNPIEAEIARGTWSPPIEGDSVAMRDSTFVTWKRFEAGTDGWFENEDLAGGFALARIDAPVRGAYLLETQGARYLYVNGEPRIGDVYHRGFVRIPVWLEQGENTLLFREGWGALAAEVYAPPEPVFIEDRDPTFPTVLEETPSTTVLVGIVVSNATAVWRDNLELVTSLVQVEPAKARAEAKSSTKGNASLGRKFVRGPKTTNPFATVPPLRTLKVAASVSVPEGFSAGMDSLTLEVELRTVEGETLHLTQFFLDVAKPTEKHYRSFLSRIDSSVQHFGVTPPPARPDTAVGLVLTLHGAGVPARQAHHYAARDWCYIVSPTNRREFGFDWEDWGRFDALEVLAEAERLFLPNPKQRWLTGHSMGGHGTWNLGALLPDLFGAIGPSAGWRDFWSYGGSEPSGSLGPLDLILARSANLSRTLLFEHNLAQGGVYILHGDEDRNVPVEQARYMRERLATFHPNFAYYERPGAGHWWGDQCMDWPPLMDFLRRNPIPDGQDVLEIDFTTVDPSVSSHCYWVGVEAQERSMVPSRVLASVDPDSSRFSIETTNVKRLLLDLQAVFPETLRTSMEALCRIDGDSLRITSGGFLRHMMMQRGESESNYMSFERKDGHWTTAPTLDPQDKGPHRGGGFKQAFQNNVLLVIGTQGNQDENRWALQKALYDAETFYYRGNGSFDITTDEEYLENAETHPSLVGERNLVLYGNADTNAALSEVLDPRCPIELRRDALAVGEHAWTGNDLGCVFIYPRKGSKTHSVGVVGGTGLLGARTLMQMPFFLSGAGFPDWLVVEDLMLETGSEGVVGAGFFGPEWNLGTDFALR